MTDHMIARKDSATRRALMLLAWGQGDDARYREYRRDTNPHADADTRAAWFAGYDHTNLAYLFGANGPTVEFQLPMSHHVEHVDPRELRTVSSLRAQYGHHSWVHGQARHAADELGREAA